MHFANLLAQSSSQDPEQIYGPYFALFACIVVGTYLFFAGRRAIKTRKTYDNYGRKVDGNTAVFVGKAYCIMSVCLWIGAAGILIFKILW